MIAPTPKHPYFPLTANVINYEANNYHFTTLLALFAAGCAAIFGATYLAMGRVRPHLPTSELLILLWFVLCGCIHTFFEGYFVLHQQAMAGQQHVFAQLWKEYCYSDSRYLTQDPFVLCMESITAICWGPLSFLIAYMIATKHPLRHPFQIIVSLGQLYGDILYYSTSLFDQYILDITYTRPEAYYYWVYFVGMNAFWIVIPGYLIWSSVKWTGRAFKALGSTERSMNGNGSLKKQL
ncbi:Emopamil-binding protein [Tothia fuscella]|uniref:Emopamil-binding protein n=1 Tax=Tothia fuscella TaxID=1048955 RepID=A0A9P4NSM6_9PEZI|nr:Emopamil-binding protein [Tothia fuscella]